MKGVKRLTEVHLEWPLKQSVHVHLQLIVLLNEYDDLRSQADQSLFNKVLHNPDHVLPRILPPVAHTPIITALDHAHMTDHSPND